MHLFNNLLMFLQAYILKFKNAYNQYNLYPKPIKIYIDGSMVEVLPTSDSIQFWPDTWLNNQINVLIETCGTQTFKI